MTSPRSFTVERRDSVPSYVDFVTNFLQPNRPGLFRTSNCDDWNRIALEWCQSDGSIDLLALTKIFSSAEVPVTWCGSNINSSTRDLPCSMSFPDYVTLFNACSSPPGNHRSNATDLSDTPPFSTRTTMITAAIPTSDASATVMLLPYLKDWQCRLLHAAILHYSLPAALATDWLNDYLLHRRGLPNDFRFVYLGPLGSFTGYHTDVLGSYSWSLNLSGRKRWRLFWPVSEGTRAVDGSVATSGAEYEAGSMDGMDSQEYEEIIQEPGELMFVPSLWPHTVLNEAACLSLNHNWGNAYNVKHMCATLLVDLVSQKPPILIFQNRTY